jgi:cation transport ATPase
MASYRRDWLGVMQRAPNMYTLIELGVMVAFTYSLIATFFPGQFPATMRDAHGMVGVYLGGRGDRGAGAGAARPLHHEALMGRQCFTRVRNGN